MESLSDQTKSCLLSFDDSTLKVVDPALTQPLATEQLDNRLVDGKYRIIKPIGHGGMGAVYEAHHELLNKRVALKTFRMQQYDAEARDRFIREARAIAKINNPNVISIFDAGFLNADVPYYTMEYLVGETVAERLLRGPLTLVDAAPIVTQVCAALAAAHAKGIVHRDLKPANLFIENSRAQGKELTVKLVDFGIASLVSAGADQRLTKAGAVIGTPVYLCPELAVGADADERGDIYSLGCVIWEMLVGSPPFKGRSSLETIAMHTSARRPLLGQAPGCAEYPMVLERLLRSMMDIDPARRPKNIDEVASQFNRILEAPSAGTKGGITTLSAAEIGAERSEISSGSSLRILPWVALVVLSLVAAGATSALLLPEPKTASFPAIISAPEKKLEMASPEKTGLTSVAMERSSDFASKIAVTNLAGPGGLPLRRVSWPLNCDVGGFQLPDRHVESLGGMQVQTWPARFKPVFEPGERFLSRPENFSAFPADLIGGIVFFNVNNHDLLHKLLLQTRRFSEIRELYFMESDLADQDMEYLNEFPILTELRLRRTKVTAKGLMSLKRFNKLTGIGFGGADNDEVRSLLSHIQGSDTIKGLYIQRHKFLSPAEFQILLSLKNLEELDLANTNATNADIEKLASLPKLRWLSVLETDTNRDLIPVLRRMANGPLRKVYVSQQTCTATDIAQLKQQVPQLSVKGDVAAFQKMEEEVKTLPP